MDKQKTQALFKWVQILLDKPKINSFGLFDDGVILLDILKLVDKDSWTDEYTDDPSGRLECIFTYLEGLYKDLRDAVSKTAVLAGNHFETAKLLAVTLVAAVNSESVHGFVEPIMTLSKAYQMNLMCLISAVNERPPERDLGELLHEALCSAVTAEESLLIKSPSSFICSPGYSYSPFASFVSSPATHINGHVRNNSHSSSIAADSPFRLIGSPRVVDRKELFEKNKLNVRIRRLNSSLATQHHMIDDLEHRLEESKKKNEVLESMNKDLNSRIKILLGLQDEVSSLRMVKVELDTKENIIERVNERLAKALEEKTLLSGEVSSLKTQFEAELQEKTEKLDRIRKEMDKLESSENALKIKNAELCDSVEIKEEEFRRVVGEKDQQCKELLDHIGFLKEKLEEPNNKEDAFVVIGDDQKCLKSEIYVVTLEEDLKKATEELNVTKEKHESARKLILELKNELNENKLTNVSLNNDLESKDAALCELRSIFEKDMQDAKEREEKHMLKISAQESTISEMEEQMSIIKDASDALKREKEELHVKMEQEKDLFIRSLHEEQMKLQNAQLEVTNIKSAKDDLEKLCKDQCSEFARKLERIEEQHEVDCYKLKEDFQKKISLLEQSMAEKTAALKQAQQTHSHLLKSKKADDDIFLARISALVEEREHAVFSVRLEMDQKISEADKDREELANELETTKNEKSEVEAVNMQLQKTVEQTKTELQKCECHLEDTRRICEEKSTLIADLEEKVQESRSTINTCNAEIDCLTLKHHTEMEKAQNLQCQTENLKEKIDAMSNESEQCIKKFETTIDRINKENSVLIHTVEEKEKETKAKSAEFDELKSSSDVCQSQLNDKIQALTKEFETVQEEKVSLITELDVVRKDLEAVNGEYKKFMECSAADLSMQKEEIGNLKEEREIMEESIRKMNEDLSGVTVELHQRNEEVTTLTAEKAELAAIIEINATESKAELLCFEEKSKEDLEAKKTEVLKIEEKLKELEAECEKKVNTVISDMDSAKTEINELVQRLNDVSKLLEDEKATTKMVKEKMDSTTCKYEKEISQLKNERISLEENLNLQLDEARKIIEAKETEHAGIIKELNLKFSQREVEIESFQKSNNMEKGDLSKECNSLKEELLESTGSLHAAIEESKRKEESCEILKREVEAISMKMKQDAQEMTEKWELEKKRLEDQVETEKESVKVFQAKWEEQKRCNEADRSEAANLKSLFEKQRSENEEEVKSLTETLRKEREGFGEQRKSMEKELSALKLALKEETESKVKQLKELELAIENIQTENGEGLKEVIEKASHEKEELLDENRKLICTIDEERQKKIEIANQVELERQERLELEKRLDLIISQKEEEITKLQDTQKCTLKALEGDKCQLENHLSITKERLKLAETRLKEEFRRVEDMKNEMNTLVENSGEEVKCLIAKHDAEKEQVLNEFNVLKNEFNVVKDELKAVSELLSIEKESTSSLQNKIEKIIKEKDEEISSVKENLESQKNSAEEQLQDSEKGIQAIEETLSETKALLEAEKKKYDQFEKEHREVCENHEREKKEMLLNFETEKENLMEKLENQASGLREELETVSTKFDEEKIRAAELLTEKENELKCHQEEVQRFQEELKFARELSEELNIKGQEEKERRDYFMKNLEDDLNVKTTEYAKEKGELVSKLEGVAKESDALRVKVEELNNKCKELVGQYEIKTQEAEEEKERILELNEKIENLQTQYDAALDFKKALQTMLDSREDENKLERQKFKDEIVDSECRIAEIEMKSEEAVSALQAKLEETARERSQIEAEKIDYQLRLVEAEKANHAFEKSIDALKEKMKEEMSLKETAFAKERGVLQTLADRVSKEVEIKNEQLQKYEAKIQAMENDLEFTKSKLQSTEAEMEKNSRSLAVDGPDGEHIRSAHSKRRRTMLPCDFGTIGNDSIVGLDDQSTLICDDLTLKRSPSLRSLNMNEEEKFGGSITSLESVDSIRSTFSRTRSLRRQSGISFGNPRRKSLLYMAGRTPPERRTTLSIPVPHLPACQMEDEPDILEDKGLSSAFEQTAKPTNFDSEWDRMSELKRRNTLCLPHLKSSYPLEVIKAKDLNSTKDAEYETTLRNGLDNTTLTDLNKTRKRPSNETAVSQQSKQKRFETASFANASTRHIKSDSNISTRSMKKQVSGSVWGDVSRIKEESIQDSTCDPRRESVAFTVSFDKPDNKKMRRMHKNEASEDSMEKTLEASNVKDTSTRHVKSDSNISTRSMIRQGSEMIWGDASRIKEESVLDATSDPRRESVAFTLCFDEPNKKLKPRASMRRSRGSSHLFTGTSTESLYASQESIAARLAGKMLPGKDKEKNAKKPTGKENKGENLQKGSSNATPLKRSQSDKATLKSRTSNLRKSIRKSISSKVRGAKAAL
ncbi:putative leucine-rich repeat-containing protein DDB_G0290503 [Rhopilema esculentum]|uniref:putative leucine-rich repeat-containing protein DDB_G0290503 n=1 Tax=Rhopilema esculentum TaxID=499914 RepID=UPI0031D7FACA